MEPRKVFLRGEVEQPLLLPPRFAGFVQTYRHGEKHTRQLLAYHFTDDTIAHSSDSSNGYVACNMFVFGGRATPVALNRSSGEMTANSYMDMKVVLMKAELAGYREKLAELCERTVMDAFFSNVGREPDNETLALMVDFAYLYFSIGSANGDYKQSKAEVQHDITVAQRRIVTPGDKEFRMPP